MMRALVTGVAGGMGYETALALISSGYEVEGLDISEPEPLDGLVFTKCDLTDSGAVAAAYREISGRGALDCIVNAAGVYDLDSLIEIDEERFRRIFEVNVGGVYRVNKAFLPLLKEGGRIIIVTSELAPLDPLPFTGIYGITKTALEKYAYSLRTELSLIGHPVVVIRPGAVDTGLLGDSVRALDRFTENTQLYKIGAKNFNKVVNSVESKNVPPGRIAKTVMRALAARRPRYVYNVNRNKLLLLLGALPDRLQGAIIRKILKK